MCLKVTVLDKNDSPPVFRDTPLTFNVSEDLNAGHLIATIRASDPDTLGTLSYSLLGGDDGKFLLEPDTGKLRLKDALDRELKNNYKLRVRVSDGVQHTDTLIIIEVSDTNDNPPVFDVPVYSFDIPENAPRGYQVGVIAAADPDLGNNAVVTYTVISDWANDMQHYILVVQAQDNGQPSLSTTLTVYCNVLDLNDNPPVFDAMSYSMEIYENVSIGTPVVTVTAADIDSGDNGRIEYTITSGDDNNDFEIFSNGTIRTRHLLDRETKIGHKKINIQILYRVSIALKDVNDEEPRFVSSNVTEMQENISTNTVVMVIKAIDRDEGRNGYIEYILEQDQALPFTLGAVDGLLRVAGKLDREQRASYTLNVTVRDRGEPSKSTRGQILVKILDENDNNPIFDPKQYSASVAENASIGAMVLQVSATDIDEGANGRVRFSIAAGDDNRDFSISEDSGIVRVAKNLNYERKSRYDLTIQAEDCAADLALANEGIEGRNKLLVPIENRYDIAELTIIITDINDNSPTFLHSPYIANVMENVIPPNSGFVIQVEAYDADTPPFNSLVRYFLKEGDTDLFRINASTGEISLLRSLDRETKAEYILTLVAMDTDFALIFNTTTFQRGDEGCIKASQSRLASKLNSQHNMASFIALLTIYD
uniref:Cadherin domain-containing protein n=1 Tax=Glossina brevipalpis TaxID=37001 RepID=A0A1A9W0E8_9MUSC